MIRVAKNNGPQQRVELYTHCEDLARTVQSLEWDMETIAQFSTRGNTLEIYLRNDGVGQDALHRYRYQNADTAQKVRDFLEGCPIDDGDYSDGDYNDEYDEDDN